MTHPLGEIRPLLAAITGLIDVVIRRDIHDIRIARMELDDDDRIASIATRQREEEHKGSEMCFHEDCWALRKRLNPPIQP